MSVQDEPEKYSIDEMMERLKHRPADESSHEGELVTRDDGSQAIRVRRRKRRSHQPHKEEMRHSVRSRMIQVSAALILLLLAVFAAGAAIIFANSAPFRAGLVEKISSSTGASAEIEQFRMNPSAANAGSLTLVWPEGNVLRELALRGIKAEISPSSFLGKTMMGEEASATDGVLTLRIPQPNKPLRTSPSPERELPVRFAHYTIPKLDIRFGDIEAPLASLLKSDASFTATNPNGRPQLLISHGDVFVSGWPNLRMDRSHIEFRGSEVDIVGMRLQFASDSRGVMELSGTISPYSADRASNLAVHLDSYLISGIVGPQIGRLFSGRIDTLSSAKSNYLLFTPGNLADGSLVISFHSSISSVFAINGFPFLPALARGLDDNWFEHPTFEDDVSGTLRRSGGSVSIGDMNFENKGRMALRGMVSLSAEQRLSGNLEVGVAEAMIKSSKNKRLDSIFGQTKDGFRWITLKISGSGGAPIDNFRELYDAAKDESPADVPPAVDDTAKPK